MTRALDHRAPFVFKGAAGEGHAPAQGAPGGPTLDAKAQLLNLLRIQHLVNDIRAARQVIDEAPVRLGEIERHFRERNAEYVGLQERYEELDRDQRARSSELASLEERRKKFMDDLMQVKNQREYAAMLKEIDTVKAQISDHEEAILRDMEQIEQLKGELETHSAHIAVEREAVARERQDVEARVATASETVAERTRQRQRHEAELSIDQRATLQRLELRRQGVFLAVADKGVCQSCFVRVRPQVFQEIKAAAAVHNCESCKRFLYHPSLCEPETAPVADGVEAANGGAV